MKRILLVVILLVGLAGLGVILVLLPGVDRAPAPVPGETPAVAESAQPAAFPAPETRREAPPSERLVATIAPANADSPQGVRGIVVDRQGNPLADAQAFLVESTTNDPIARFQSLARDVPFPPAAATATDAAGAFQLGLRAATDRQFEVFLLAEGFAEERIGDLQLHADRWLDLGRITLFPGSMIRGRVTIAGTELPVPLAVVTLASGDPFLDLGLRNLPGWRGSRTAAVDAAGRYELAHAPRAGQFRLTAVAPGFARLIKEQIEVQAEGAVEVNFELLRGLSIGGWILDADGRPVLSADLEAWPAAAEPAYFGTVQADGRFQILGLREGLHKLTVHAGGYQPLEVPDVQAGAQDLRLVLEPRGTAAVVVRAPDGQVLRNYKLSVRQFFAENRGQIATLRDVPDRTIHLGPAEDAAKVSGLDPGPIQLPVTYAFQVQADGFAKTLSGPFTLDKFGAGPTVEVTMSLGGTIRGQTLDEAGRPVAGATVTTQPAGTVDENPVWRMLASLTPDKITRATATSGAGGGFLLGQLAHADYQLEVQHPEFCRSIRRGVCVTADGELPIAPVVLRRGALLRGRAFVDGAPAAQVRVVLTQADPAAGPADETADETMLVRVEAVSDNDGDFTMPRRVPPGIYELRARLQVGSGPQADVFQQLSQMQRSAVTLMVAPGQETIEQEIRLTTRP